MSKTTKNNQRRWLRWIAEAVWALVIFLLSHESADGSQVRSDGIVELLHAIGLGGSADVLSTIIRKAAHLTLYAVLGGLLVWALAAYRNVTAKLVGIAVVIACAYAVTDELHQALIPGRSGEVRDVLIDTAGAMAGVGAVGYGYRRQKRFTDTTESAKVSE